MTMLRKLARYALLAALAAAVVACAVFVVLAGEGVELPWDMLPAGQPAQRHDPQDEG
ncbi:MAG TPA: hypothetical protein VFB06_09270 [Streptosporangiaceae bacterium]|nr:hypothetical protein [Streptosporangiaceae bacterium]